MKRGRYFTIPETPADLDRLWQAGAPLEADSLPAWALHPNLYRHIGSASCHGQPSAEDYWLEAEELQRAGIILERGNREPRVDHFYLMDPQVGWFNEAEWAIGIYAGQSPTRLGPIPGATNPVITREHITDIAAAFVADPFLIQANQQWFMFFEVMNYHTGKGDIGLATSHDGLQWHDKQIVLSEDFHLSYPCVFEWERQFFMIPESHQAGAVRLYRADDFPMKWSLVTELLRAPYLADPSILQHDGRWWMFVDASTDLANDTLRLYHADHLAGPWIEHPMSPIVRLDCRIARPGGRVIHGGDKLIRYTQGCTPYYGTDVRAFEITELTRSSYRERAISDGPILGPTGQGWNACGMHHVDAHAVNGGWLAGVDGWRSESLLRQR
jgi:hypothetical protein